LSRSPTRENTADIDDILLKPSNIDELLENTTGVANLVLKWTQLTQEEILEEPDDHDGL
jgi:hypothetical protein